MDGWTGVLELVVYDDHGKVIGTGRCLAAGSGVGLATFLS